MFLDIEMPEMPGMDGIEAAEHITAIDSGIDIAFVTTYNQYAIEAFKHSLNEAVSKVILLEQSRLLFFKKWKFLQWLAFREHEYLNFL